MRGTRAASRYAKSILSLSIERNEQEAIYKDMLYVAGVCNENRELGLLLTSPVVKADKKESILTSVFAGGVSKLTMEFITILTSKNRSALIPQICESFVTQYNTHNNVVTAKITTATALDTASKEKIMAIVKERNNGEVQLIEEVNGDLIGGFVLRIGDEQLDASVQHKLNNLRKEFSKNTYVNEL